jgi:hypothetical protein
MTARSKASSPTKNTGFPVNELTRYFLFALRVINWP